SVRTQRGGGGVVDGDELTGGVAQTGEIALKLLGRGQRCNLAARVVLAQPLKRDHEEHAVAAIEDFGQIDRAVEFKSEGALLEKHARQAGLVGRPIVGPQLVVLEELEQLAVEAVGAGLGDDGGYTAANTAILRVIVVGLDGELLRAIERRCVDYSAIR